jgi:quercetin dioxygenase-like cupin family protein
MQFRTIGLLLLGAMALPASGTAQTTPAPPAITRTVVAATKLPTVTDVPLHFKAVSITLQPDAKSSVSTANGILYQMSGSTEVVLDGEAKKVNAGEGLFIAGGKTAALTAGSEGPSNLLHFFLAPPRGSYVCSEGVEPKPQTALRFTPSTSFVTNTIC